MFEDFLKSQSPAIYAKMHINNSPDENKKNGSNDKRQNIRFKRENKRNEQNRKKNADETLKIIKEILDYNKNVQTIFKLASKVDKGKSEPKTKESIAERVKLKNEKIAEI